jgi:hypothetical protein
MTTYSVLVPATRTTVIATWPGVFSDVSMKVTTVDGRGLAADVASLLASLSEGAWYAAAWLDTWHATAEYVRGLHNWLRQPRLTGRPPLMGP